jgi:hypothetical protein
MRPPNPSHRGEKPGAKHRHAMHMGTANTGALLFKDAVLGSSLLKLALDGLEREFKFFNWLEGRMHDVCTGRSRKIYRGPVRARRTRGSSGM